jgi:hypothetical protein
MSSERSDASVAKTIRIRKAKNRRFQLIRMQFMFSQMINRRKKMKRIRQSCRAICTIAALLSLLAFSGIARGDIPVSGIASADFVNPSPAGGTDGVVVTGVGTNNFTWGQGSGTPPNSMTFVANSFSTTTETPFKIGTLTYFNGTTVSGTTPTTVQLGVNLNFTQPNVGNQMSNFTLGLISTTNTSDPVASADFVTFPSNFSSTVFSLDGTNYTLMLTGFQNVQGAMGFLGSNGNTEFHVEEGGTASADLYGEVTANVPSVVPEPSSFVIAFFGAGGMIAFGLRRRKA